MAARRSLGLMTPILALGTVALVAAIGHGLVTGAETAVPTQAQQDAGALPDLAPIEPFALPEPASLGAIVDRPLFSATRRAPSARPAPPPEPEPVVVVAPPPPQAQVELGQFKLVGIVDDGTRRYALLRPRDETELVRAELGALVLDWRVEEIELDAVVISQKGVRDTLLLRDNKADPDVAGRAKLMRATAANQAVDEAGTNQGNGDIFTRNLRAGSGGQGDGQGVNGGNGQGGNNQVGLDNGTGALYVPPQ